MIKALRAAHRTARIAKYQKEFGARYQVEVPSHRERVPIMIPETLSLRDNYDETVAVLETMRELVLGQRTPVFLYFNQLKHLEPAAALLLVAEVFRCRQLRIWRHEASITGNYPVDSAIFFQLREMGFFHVLGLTAMEEVTDKRPQGERPYYVHFRTMNSVHPELAARFCDLIAQGAFEMTPLAKNRMVAALKEAMGNAHEHAYVMKSEYDYMPRRWWLAGYVNPAHKEMMVLILDQGVGIPRTLPPTAFEMLTAILNASWGPTDGNMIAAATELHRTSTEQRGRGRGFQDMKRFIDTCDDGELRVCSNRGAYTYTKEHQTIADFPSSIGGTLVQWRVRHEGAALEIVDE
ncbi:hypothetical protein [Bradyrhizobium sp. 2S1]|uniref:hypothetical protein n=1 Tax=Bradyrhizobium sp. 2S1 TaxID=1404429 RepID=UPI0014098D25|nr:hypothetical protein [Bradyrhizobium sp. 2S1]MCK7670139.1 hypothetical protein [Bradyrhizobium sp. 2S1]